MTDEQLTMDSAAGRRLLATTVLGSGMVFLDGTITNVALPRIGRDLHASLGGLLWVVNGYTLTLAALIIVGGSLGDRFGRKRVYGLGVTAFVVASVLVAIAPTISLLIAARLIQGVAAAALTPGSLAMLQTSFTADDRLKAIGAWSGMLGIATATGPVIGGWLVGLDWRYGFWLNVPLGALVLLLLRSAPESSDPQASRRLDAPAVFLTILMLAGLTWSLTDWTSALTPYAASAAVSAAILLVIVERRTREPMIPLSLFANRTFAAINLATLFVYAAFGGALFFLALYLQVAGGWSPLAAGAAALPISAIMLGLSGWFGGYATKRSARGVMVTGMLIVAVGFTILSRAPRHPSYVVNILPGVVVQGFGMSMLVSALTGTVLSSVPVERSGLASGLNNAISRTAGLISVAALPMIAGLSGKAYTHPSAVAHGYDVALRCCAASMLVAATITALGLGRTRSTSTVPHPNVGAETSPNEAVAEPGRSA